VPRLGDEARRLVAELERIHAATGPTEPRPVHGALHPSQWLDDGSRLGLVDYDSVGLGDPELDAATFLADLDVQNRARVATDRLNAAFLTGYESVADLDAGLVRAYRVHGRLGRAVKIARALCPNGDEKAARRLRSALEYVGGSS
jgi:aminoglycoside phosphotransferase (APT) family kinase protein